MIITRTALQSLLAPGESDTLELKRSTGELKAAMQTLCGFLNHRGGAVVIGVAVDGRIVGQAVTDSTLRDVATAVRDLDPAPQVDLERVEADDQTVLVLRVARGGAVPYTYDGRAYIRVGSTTRRMRREEYERLLLSRLHAQYRWETLPALGWTVEDLDADEIRRAVVESVQAKRLLAVPSESPEVILQRLNLLADGRPTQAAVVLFGKNPMPQYPQCAIRLARFRGVTKTEFIDNREFRGHAFALMREAEAFFDTHLPVASRVIPGRMRREDRPQYPPEALREALVNALCHRDYSEPGASIGVAIYDDRLEIWSWGRLPEGWTTDRLRVDHPSVRRNDLIAEAFYRRAYIEKWGRGTQRVILACRDAGLREPEFLERAGETGVRFWAAAPTATMLPPTELTPRQREVLSAVTSLGEAAPAEIRTRLQAPPQGRVVRGILAELLRKGHIERLGQGRSTRYRPAR